MDNVLLLINDGSCCLCLSFLFFFFFSFLFFFFLFDNSEIFIFEVEDFLPLLSLFLPLLFSSMMLSSSSDEDDKDDEDDEDDEEDEEEDNAELICSGGADCRFCFSVSFFFFDEEANVILFSFRGDSTNPNLLNNVRADSSAL